MWLRDVWNLWRVAQLRGLVRLITHSRGLRELGGSYSVISSLIALEKCGLVDQLLSADGLDPTRHSDLDQPTLLTICEYLARRHVLATPVGGVFRPARPKAFHALRQVVYACLAYHEPVQRLDALLQGRVRYGCEVSRNEYYDALASATLTSQFSFGFAAEVLRKVRCERLLDLGCGTGAFLHYLAANRFEARLLGLDHSEETIRSAGRPGVHPPQVELFAGDILRLQASPLDLASVGVFSFMFVLHEFPDARVHEILTSIRSRCPKARILLTELLSSPGYSIKQRYTALPELEFVHKLSNQILRTAEQWLALFHEHSFEVEIAAENRLANHLCYCFQSI